MRLASMSFSQTTFKWLMTLCFGLNSHQSLAEQRKVQLKSAPIEHVFIPQGFDDNDNAEVVIQGRFSNACMKTGPIEKQINSLTQTITLTPRMYVYEGEACAQVIVPFIQRVTFGHLSPGEWTVLIADNRDLKIQAMTIRKAVSASPDDFLYAPVDEVVLLPGLAGTRQKLIVSGNWPVGPVDACFQLKEIRTLLGPDNTLVVQPIAEILSRDSCPSQTLRHRVFQGSVMLDKPLVDDSLVHVRVLNGESLNKFYEAL
jgi:hypothetical protein